MRFPLQGLEVRRFKVKSNHEMFPCLPSTLFFLAIQDNSKILMVDRNAGFSSTCLFKSSNRFAIPVEEQGNFS